jgi:hypothetical protein
VRSSVVEDSSEDSSVMLCSFEDSSSEVSWDDSSVLVSSVVEFSVLDSTEGSSVLSPILSVGRPLGLAPVQRRGLGHVGVGLKVGKGRADTWCPHRC